MKRIFCSDSDPLISSILTNSNIDVIGNNRLVKYCNMDNVFVEI